MKENYVHVCFVIDESGSMYTSIDDVKGGFKKIVEEQSAKEEGKCSVSMFSFNDKVTQHFLGKDVKEVESTLPYSPGGCTALNDGVGQAIDEVGKWLREMPEDERPSSNLIVIMTDGGENASKEYSLTRVREMIKHQTDKYNWTFMYMGADITSSDIADSMGVKYRGFSSKSNLASNYAMFNSVLGKVRSGESLDSATCAFSSALNDTYAKETGIKLGNIGGEE